MVVFPTLVILSTITSVLSSPFSARGGAINNASRLSKRNLVSVSGITSTAGLTKYSRSAPLGSAGSNGMSYSLGAACKFIVTGQTGISTVPASSVAGDIGVSPIAITAITGFSMNTGSPGTSSQINPGNAWGPASGPGEPATTIDSAVAASNSAYTSYSNMKVDYADFLAGQLPDKTVLKPGVYKWSSTVVIPVGATIYLDGNCGDQFVFIATGAISTGANSNIVMSAGPGAPITGSAASVFWVGATALTTGVASNFQGIILTYTNVVIAGTLVGMAYTQTEIALHAAAISRPKSCSGTGYTFSYECDPTVTNGLTISAKTDTSTAATAASACLTNTAAFLNFMKTSASQSFISSFANYAAQIQNCPAQTCSNVV